MRFCRWICLISLFSVTCSTVDGQVIRNQLPLVTKTSALADRLYSRILLNINSDEIELAGQNIERLCSQHTGTLVAVANRHQVEATLLADQLMKIAVGSSGSKSLENSGHFDTFALWRSNLRGKVTTTELLELGDEFWLHGKIEAAQQCWRLASEVSTNAEKIPLGSSKLDDAHKFNLDIQKREIVSYLLTGNFRLGQKSLKRLKKTYPDAVGKVAGQEGVIFEILSRLAESLEYADRESFIRRQDRLPFESVRYDLIALDWTVPVQCNSTNSQAVEPLIWNDVLILQDANGVRTLSIESGQPAWSIGPEDQGYIFETTTFSETSTDISMVCNGGVVDGHTWYGRTGTEGFVENKQVDPPQQSRISALNLNAEGRLEWTRTTSDLSSNNQLQSRIFSGTPVVNDVNIFVPIRTSTPGNQLLIACLNREDGSEIWLKEIAASLKIPAKFQGFNDQLILEGNTLYWLIDGVAVACVNAVNGQLLWVSAVQPIADIANQRVQSSHDLIMSEDSILCSTLNGVAAFNKFTGKLNWEQYLQNPPRALLGINDGLLIASDPGLCALDVDSSKIVWQQNQQNSNPAHHNGVLSGRSIFYQDQDQLFTVDAHSGRVLQQDQFPNGLASPISAISVFSTKLMVQDSSRLQAYRVLLHSD